MPSLLLHKITQRQKLSLIQFTWTGATIFIPIPLILDHKEDQVVQNKHSNSPSVVSSAMVSRTPAAGQVATLSIAFVLRLPVSTAREDSASQWKDIPLYIVEDQPTD